ncbi:hypothetical protein CIPAW_06G102000 [Carya illinoinensis]|uniref:Uncharacterized protein n=1 Tax=Carya illinoinensis TaxID=32201 RepID=A0A8T1Q9W9_CARIL|nr:hypothetical protein CIPAW_06G102000 [Carya illinoinensis]KAG6651310.1 hypothetical protein CIPAW_06G102000 [Carya illinoinensis]KAG6708853.1 hypothetical protein I3842_06G102400 [Carya illinoinensis]KAG6708854.1 hypothetical protein I3842_06G102400 [Carya illinoinensis]
MSMTLKRSGITGEELQEPWKGRVLHLIAESLCTRFCTYEHCLNAKLQNSLVYYFPVAILKPNEIVLVLVCLNLECIVALHSFLHMTIALM